MKSARESWDDYLERLRIDKKLPILTNVEILVGKNRNDHNWRRAFLAPIGARNQKYFHIYLTRHIDSSRDLARIIKSCVKKRYDESFKKVFKTSKLKKVGRKIISCCPIKHYNKLTGECDIKRFGKQSGLIDYKLLIPIEEMPRLIKSGRLRFTKIKINGLNIGRFFEK